MWINLKIKNYIKNLKQKINKIDISINEKCFKFLLHIKWYIIIYKVIVNKFNFLKKCDIIGKF
jgi:hypothetical protein